MKIRELDLDQYVIVYDIGKSEKHKGMTVVGRVEEIVFNDDGENTATINSLGNLYDIADDNEFELWTKSIEDKTESVSEKTSQRFIEGWAKDLYGDRKNIEDNFDKLHQKIHEVKSNDVQQRKRKGKEEPEYPEDMQNPDVYNNSVNHPTHYNYGDIEVIDYCDQVCKTYPPELAPYVFNAIKYLSRANHKNGLEDIQKAQYYVERLFDKWEQ